MNKDRQLAVAALCDGTVIDHIPSEALFKVVRILDIPSMKESVTIGFNLESARLGKKGIIKVSGTEFRRDIINRIAIVAPGAVINTIRNYSVVNKETVSLPHEIRGLVSCNNPKCITRHEPMDTRFDVVSDSPVTIRCRYCGQEMQGDAINLL